MRTNIVIDDRLIEEAMRKAGLKTKRAAVEAGLRLLIEVKSQARVRRLRGKIPWAGDVSESPPAKQVSSGSLPEVRGRHWP